MEGIPICSPHMVINHIMKLEQNGGTKAKQLSQTDIATYKVDS